MERQIAWRFMMKGTDKGRLSPMTIFAWLAIGVGVSAMSCLLGVMYGFEGALKTRVLGAYPHIMIRPPATELPITKAEEFQKKLESVSLVSKVVPLIETEMILQSDNRSMGGVVYGMPRAEFGHYEKGLQEGKLPDVESALPQIVLGSELARRLQAQVGSQIRVFSPTERSGLMGLAPRLAVYEVSGLYASGHYEYDQQMVLMDLQDAQDLLRWKGGISGFQVWTQQLEDAKKTEEQIRPFVPGDWKVQSWEEFNSALFSSLKLEQYAMFVILTFAIVIAVMNIIITLMMHVSHKKLHIGILRALGASTKQIRGLFVWQGTLMGGVGLLLGGLLTAVFVVYVRFFSDYQLPEIYYDRTLPIEMRPIPILLIYTVAVLLIFLATLYPAKKAAEIDPIEAIRQ